MGTPILRPARADEAPELYETMVAALTREVTAGGIVHAYPNPQSEVAWRRYLLATGSGWVAEADGSIAGFGITERLKLMQDKYEMLGDMRGPGLMIGIERVKNRETRESARDETARFVEERFKRGVLFGHSK
jgi:hypothetical protein